MELFERIRYLSKKSGYSLAKIAGCIGVTPQAFNKWLDAKSQRNLWEHLPGILKLFPEVRPEWLYMGQEPAFHDGTGPGPQPPTREEFDALQAKLAEREGELREANQMIRQLTARLLVDGVGDKDAAPGIGNTADGQG